MKPDIHLCGAVSAPPFRDGGAAHHGEDCPFPPAGGERPAPTRVPAVPRRRRASEPKAGTSR
ncbi:hypothetical protein SHL15_8694 [Streptomyces hygroscopicus subsp. limoneus]|nr:hypothetical protein SHL15_8694 [Streptomyces hygroscopicus subsp. limoneus]